MRSTKIALGFAALAIGGALAAGPALAQNSGRAPNDGGLINSQTNPPPQQGDYYAPQTGMNAAGEQGAGGNCAARFHSFDPSTGTYLGFDGKRHSCP